MLQVEIERIVWDDDLSPLNISSQFLCDDTAKLFSEPQSKESPNNASEIDCRPEGKLASRVRRLLTTNYNCQALYLE
jgi:hypothetical protein